MNLIETLIIRGAMLFLGLWVGIGMVFTVVILLESWKRRNYTVRAYAVTECPACQGTGFTPEQEICGLCDGESAITSELLP